VAESLDEETHEVLVPEGKALTEKMISGIDMIRLPLLLCLRVIMSLLRKRR
jgi:hypothetical protein